MDHTGDQPGHRLRIGIAGYRHRCLRRRRPETGGAWRGGRRAHRHLSRRHVRSRRPDHNYGELALLAAGQSDPRPALPSNALHHLQISEQRAAATLTEKPARSCLASFPRLPRPASRARDPGLRHLLQACGPARAIAAASLPDRHGLQRLRSRRCAGDRRSGPDHRRHIPRGSALDGHRMLLGRPETQHRRRPRSTI